MNRSLYGWLVKGIMAVMRHEIKVPQQGYTTEYVTITKLYVGVGDTIKEGMPIYEMESDKTTADVNSLYSGTVAEILKNQGDEADVGETVMIVEE